MRMGMTRRKRHRWLCIPFAMLVAAALLVIKLEPAFVMYLDADANTLVTTAINKSVAEVFESYDSSGLYHNENDAFSVNTAEVNKLKAKITLRLQEMFNKESIVKIPIGSATGFYLFNGSGPSIPVKITPLALVNSDIEDEFTSEGINFVKHSMYMNISVSVNYSGFLIYKNSTVTARVPILEHISSGNVPQYYGEKAGVTIAK